MKLFQHPGGKLFGLDELTDDWLIDHYNICLNYKAYIFQLLKMPDKQLIMFAPGNSADQVRVNLTRQMKSCDEYIAMWNQTISQKEDPKNMS